MTQDDDLKNVYRQCEADVIAKLRADPRMDKYRVTLMTVDQKDVVGLIRRALSTLKGPLVMVTPTGAHNNFPAIDVNFKLTVTEAIALNRTQPVWASAMDVADICARILHGAEFPWLDSTQSIDRTGEIDQAEAMFTCRYDFFGD